MGKRFNPSFDYDASTVAYTSRRREDPRIALRVLEALGPSRTVLNVGAGAGAYEPGDRPVVAVEPSRSMRDERVRLGKVPAVDATAEILPFDDGSFDAAMAVLTVHHWGSLEAGVAELRRVSRRRAVIMSFDPAALDTLWNVHYFPEVVEAERRRYPRIERIVELLDARCAVVPVPVPLDCLDGFQEAFYGRPEAFLDAEVRRCQSAWAFVDAQTERRCVGALERDLASGAWDRAYGSLRAQPFFTGALRLVVAHLGSSG